MKNTLSDLNNHLFEQLERLNDDDLKGEAFETEIKRSEKMAKLAQQIIKNGELAYKVMAHRDEYGYGKKTVPDMLEAKEAHE